MCNENHYTDVNYSQITKESGGSLVENLLKQNFAKKIVRNKMCCLQASDCLMSVFFEFVQGEEFKARAIVIGLCHVLASDRLGE